MLGGTMTMASRAMAQPQLTESPHLCKAWKGRRSLEWLVGHLIVQHGRQWMWPPLPSTNLSSSRQQETHQVLPIQVIQLKSSQTSSCRLHQQPRRVQQSETGCAAVNLPTGHYDLFTLQLLSPFIWVADLCVICFVHSM